MPPPPPPHDPTPMLRFYQHDGERGKDLLRFHEVATPESIDSHTYRCNVHPEYSYGTAAHGGYLVSLFQQCLTLHFLTTHSSLNQPHTTALHNEFLRPATTGPVLITIADIRLGKATSSLHLTLTQHSAVKCVAYATQSGPRASQNTITMDLGYRLEPPLPEIDFDAVLEGKDRKWVRVDVGRDPEIGNHVLCNVVFCFQRFPEKSDRARRMMNVWLCPRIEEERWTASMLGMVLDHSPPPMENFFPDAEHNNYSIPVRAIRNEDEGKTTYDHPPWNSPRFYSTVNMSIDIKHPAALPPTPLPPHHHIHSRGERFLLLRYTMKNCVEGRLDVEIEVWNSQGVLIAVAQSLWYVIETSLKVAGGGVGTSGRFQAGGKGTRPKI